MFELIWFIVGFVTGIALTTVLGLCVLASHPDNTEKPSDD